MVRHFFIMLFYNTSARVNFESYKMRNKIRQRMQQKPDTHTHMVIVHDRIYMGKHIHIHTISSIPALAWVIQSLLHTRKYVSNKNIHNVYKNSYKINFTR